MGVLNILIGIISALSSTEIIYFTAIGLLFIAMLLYFLIIIHNNKGKGISGITVNMMLWILPFFGPIIYAVVLKIAKEVSDYSLIADPVLREQTYPLITFLNKYDYELMWGNVVFIFIMMLLFSIKIKQWRGVAEN
jgi:hypothetical protein